MGARIPVVSGREAAKAFEQLGRQFLRQRGSHMVYGKPDVPANLSIPDHNELSKGTLRSLIRTAGIGIDEFTATLGKQPAPDSSWPAGRWIYWDA